jgi:hypothetical protein
MEMSKMRAKITEKLFHSFLDMKVNVHHRTGHTCDVRYAICTGLPKSLNVYFVGIIHISGFDKLIFYLKEITRIMIFYILKISWYNGQKKKRKNVTLAVSSSIVLS